MFVVDQQMGDRVWADSWIPGKGLLPIPHPPPFKSKPEFNENKGEIFQRKKRLRGKTSALPTLRQVTHH